MRGIVTLWCFSLLSVVVNLGTPKNGGRRKTPKPDTAGPKQLDYWICGLEHSLNEVTWMQDNGAKTRIVTALWRILQQFISIRTVSCRAGTDSWSRLNLPHSSRSLTSLGQQGRPARALLGGVEFPGVNLAGGEFGQVGQPLGVGYIYPSDESFNYYAKRGMRLVRLPFKIERVQPKAMGEFSMRDIAELDRCVRAARAVNMLIVLDAHNYGLRDGRPFQAAELADFWSRIAKRYHEDVHVALGLMSEPAAFKPYVWRAIVDYTLKTLRNAGSKHLVLVSGGGWSSAHDFVSDGNALAFQDFSDSNFLIEVHQFLDPDSSGTHLYEYEKGSGANRLKAFTAWARQRGYGAFLGAFGFAMPKGETEARALLGYMRDNADVWRAHSYWAGGPWWHDYAFSIEPTPQGDRPQMVLLMEFSRIDATASWCDTSVPPGSSRPSKLACSQTSPRTPRFTTFTSAANRRSPKPSFPTSVPSPLSCKGGQSFPPTWADDLRGLTGGQRRPGSGAPKRRVALPGVSLAGGEFGRVGQPLGVGYIYPSDESFEYYANRGIRLVRLPFMIERVQPKAMGEFFERDVTELDRCVRAARAANILIVLDAHNYGRRDGQPLKAADLANFWFRIAERYRGMAHVALGLMNEPEAFTPDVWRVMVDHTLKTLREAGSKHLVMVPGGGWDGAHDWVSGGNARAFDGFSDTNFLIEVHQYLDHDYSGTHVHEYTQGSGATRLKAFTEWARRQGYGAFLGEFGFAMPEGETEARALLSFMRDNADVWLANAYWAGGPWWHNYAFSIEPTPQGDRPQMVVVKQFL